MVRQNLFLAEGTTKEANGYEKGSEALAKLHFWGNSNRVNRRLQEFGF